MRNINRRALLATLTFSTLFSINKGVAAAELTYESFLGTVVKVFLPIAIGGIGVPLIIINGYKLMVSEGDPQKAREGKEGLTAAVIGLMFLLFSMTILNLLLNAFFGV